MQELTNEELDIINYLKECKNDPKLTYGREIARALKISYPTALKRLAVLEQKGTISYNLIGWIKVWSIVK